MHITTQSILTISLTILSIFPICSSLYQNKPQYKIRQTISYQLSFSQSSNITLLFSSCGQISDLRQSILSFFYYNTYPLRKMILVDRCSTPISNLKTALPKLNNNQQNNKWYTILTFTGNQIEMLHKLFENVKTKYVINYANKWITYKGIGFIQQAIDVLQSSKQNKIRISQVTSMFPLWRNFRALGIYHKTRLGNIFYQIRSFKPTQRYYFTFNPSVINFEIIYKDIIKSNFINFCSEHHCQGSNGLDCCQLELGKVLFDVNQFKQVYIDDGTVQANVFNIR